MNTLSKVSQVSLTDFSIDEGCECITLFIQSNEGVVKDDGLLLFDYRPASLEAFQKGVSREEMYDVINRSARLEITDYTVSLFPLKKGERNDYKLLFSSHKFIGKHNADYEFIECFPFWYWKGESNSRTGRHWGMSLVCLTSRDHKVSVYREGYANIWHTDLSYLVISDAIEYLDKPTYSRLYG